jgi:polar amino acid transport system substrate-binding protein
MTFRNKFATYLFLMLALLLNACGKNQESHVSNLSQLANQEIGVPTGTVADKLVLSKIPTAQFKYFNSVLDAAIAVQQGKIAATAYDEPILKNIAAKNSGLRVLSELITKDNYGYAVRLEDKDLKQTIDNVMSDLKKSGEYDEMLHRWLPEHGDPGPMKIIQTGDEGVLRFGTSAITEPFSYVDGSQQVVGLDIEIASLVAKKLGKRLEVVNMEFGSMIPALIANKVDMIGACITITDERAKKVLFSEPYYVGGIAALVKE